MAVVDSTFQDDRLYELVLVISQVDDDCWEAALYDRADGPVSVPVCEGFGSSRRAAVKDLLRTVL